MNKVRKLPIQENSKWIKKNWISEKSTIWQKSILYLDESVVTKWSPTFWSKHRVWSNIQAYQFNHKWIAKNKLLRIFDMTFSKIYFDCIFKIKSRVSIFYFQSPILYVLSNKFQIQFSISACSFTYSLSMGWAFLHAVCLILIV